MVAPWTHPHTHTQRERGICKQHQLDFRFKRHCQKAEWDARETEKWNNAKKALQQKWNEIVDVLYFAASKRTSSSTANAKDEENMELAMDGKVNLCARERRKMVDMELTTPAYMFYLQLDDISRRRGRRYCCRCRSFGADASHRQRVECAEMCLEKWNQNVCMYIQNVDMAIHAPANYVPAFTSQIRPLLTIQLANSNGRSIKWWCCHGLNRWVVLLNCVTLLKAAKMR